MSYRGAGTTGKMIEHMRDDVLRALDGYVLDGYDGNGEPVYTEAGRDELRMESRRYAGEYVSLRDMGETMEKAEDA